MASSTREKLIQTAHDLFYRDGFHSVGLDRIISEVGVTKTTFYNHFQSKDDLMLEVLRWHDRWWRDTFVQMLRLHGGNSPRGQLLAIVDALNQLFNSKGYNGCMFINMAVEFPLLHDPAHLAAADHKRAMEDLLCELAGYAGANDPQALAKEIALVMEGAYVTKQVSPANDISETVRRLVEMILDRHIPRASHA